MTVRAPDHTRRPRPALRMAPPPRPRGRRSGRALLVSLLAHAVVLLVVAQALRVPMYVGTLFERTRPEVRERLTYVETAVGGGGSPGGLAPVPEPAPEAEARAPVAPPPLAAPRETPSVIAAPPAAPAARPGAAGAGDGTGAGRPGPAAGLQPTYTGPTVWVRPEPPPPRMPMTAAEKIDEMIAEDFGVLRDSVAAEAAKRRPGDWTFEREGRKYGMDEQWIHLGRISIPTALLGMLPLRTQPNPIQVERGRSYSQMSRESRDQGLRVQNDKDFRDVVREIRERNDRERSERLAREAEARRGAGDPPR